MTLTLQLLLRGVVRGKARVACAVLGIAAAVFFLVLSKKTGGTAESNPADNGSESADEAK